MFYNFQHGGNGSWLVPCHIFDASGCEHPYVIECDTETGRLRKYKPGKDGIALGGDGYPIRLTVDVPAPLRIEGASNG